MNLFIFLQSPFFFLKQEQKDNNWCGANFIIFNIYFCCRICQFEQNNSFIKDIPFYPPFLKVAVTFKNTKISMVLIEKKTIFAQYYDDRLI